MPNHYAKSSWRYRNGSVKTRYVKHATQSTLLLPRTLLSSTQIRKRRETIMKATMLWGMPLLPSLPLLTYIKLPDLKRNPQTAMKQLLASNDVHTNYCGADRTKPMLFTNCHANDCEVALADSAAHLAHCCLERQTHMRHDALLLSLLEMPKKAKYGWDWRRDFTLLNRCQCHHADSGIVSGCTKNAAESLPSGIR